MRDVRSLQTSKIQPPKPLPHVSRKALARVRDRIEPPTECRYCGGPVALVSNAEIYGCEYGEWPYAYRCDACDAHIGLHPHTDLPLGTLADAELRRSRIENKDLFNKLMRRLGWPRSAAYSWLAQAMGLDPSECHWGLFEVEDCERAGMLCAQKMNEEAA